MATPRFITAGEIQLTTIYIQFDVNVHSSEDLGQIFTIGGDDLTNQNATAFFSQNGTGLAAFDGAQGFHINIADGFIIDEFHTVNLAISIVPPNTATVSGIIDDVPLQPSSQPYASLLGVLEIKQIAFGAINATDLQVNHHIKNIKIGTGGFGSSNLFNFDLQSAVIDGSLFPQFDSVTGDGIVLSDDGILFENAGTDVYAAKSLIFP